MRVACRVENELEFTATRFVNNIPTGLSKWGKYECVATCNLEKNKKNMWRIAECEYSCGTPGRLNRRVECLQKDRYCPRKDVTLRLICV